MILIVKRIAKRETYTIGHLYVDGVKFCDTIEDKDRALDQTMDRERIAASKVYGETAIPTGTYTIDMATVSPKFKNRTWAKPYGGKIPRLVNVPGFQGVLIHPMNTAEDSLGCIGVGRNTEVGKVTSSQATFSELMNKHLVPAISRGETIKITIR